MQTPMERQELQEDVLLLTDTNPARQEVELDLTSSNSPAASSSVLFGDDTARDKRISSFDPEFDKIALSNGLRTSWNETRAPDNLASIQAALTSARDEEPPSEASFQEYRADISGASNEAEILCILIRYLWKFYETPYKTKTDVRFILLPRDVGFNNDSAPPQPDIVQGFEETAFEDGLLEPIEGAVPHGRFGSSVALPHLAGELKHCRGDMVQARLQSCYDGAALLWARHNALDFLGRPEHDEGQARVFTFTYNGTYLEVFACLRVRTENGRVEYHQYQLRGLCLVAEYDDFRTGWTVLRNLQDLAKKESSDLRDLLSKDKSVPSSSLTRTDNETVGNKRKRQATSPSPESNLIEAGVN